MLGGSWLVISSVISPLIWMVTLLIAPLITTHEPPSVVFFLAGKYGKVTLLTTPLITTHEPPSAVFFFFAGKYGERTIIRMNDSHPLARLAAPLPLPQKL